MWMLDLPLCLTLIVLKIFWKLVFLNTYSITGKQANFENNSSETCMGADVQHNYPWLTWATTKFNLHFIEIQVKETAFLYRWARIKALPTFCSITCRCFQKELVHKYQCYHVCANENKDEVQCWTRVIYISCLCVVDL